MRISDWSSDVCSSDLPGIKTRHAREYGKHAKRDDGQRQCPGLKEGKKAVPPAASDDADRHDEAERANGHPAPQEQRPERSEEHTSELQSLMRISYAVFCLRTKIPTTITIINHLLTISIHMYNKYYKATIISAAT